MRIIIRTSKLASYSRRLASIALPIFVFSVLLHRSNSIISETFNLLISIGFIFAFLGLVLGIAGLIQLWFSGDKGWNRAITGISIGIICLSPLVYGTIEAQKYPNISDISTNPNLNIELISDIKENKKPQKITQAELREIFPNLIARNYQIEANDLYEITLEQAKRKGWQIIKKQPINEINKKAQINAIKMSLFGWRDEIAILILKNENNSFIAMRSASILATNDLGKNGKRIETFLVDLDEAVTKYSSKLLGAEPQETIKHN